MRTRTPIALSLCATIVCSALAVTPEALAEIPAAVLTTPQPAGGFAVRFEPNAGQLAPGVAFEARLMGGSVQLQRGGIDLAPDGVGEVVRLRFVDASTKEKPIGLDQSQGVTNYLLGNDKSKWVTGVPGYSRVAYTELYPGIDLVLRGSSGRLELGFDLAPDADVGRIRMQASGAQRVAVGQSGDLLIRTSRGELMLGAPRLTEGSGPDGRAVAGAFVIGADGAVGFKHVARAAGKPLGIVPTVSYSTLLGGSSTESAGGLGIGPDGSIFVAGATASGDFPSPGSAGGTRGGGQDIFVTKLNPTATAILYTTFIGGAGTEVAGAIHVDSTGAVYVTGNSNSTDFPTVNPVQATNRGSFDVVIAKLDPSGANLAYSTYLGGGDLDRPNDIDVDGTGAVAVAGVTFSGNYPLANAAQTSYGGGASDGFVSLLSPDGGTLTASTFVGGNGSDLLLTAKFRDGLVQLGGGSDSTDVSFSGAARFPGVPGCGDLRFLLNYDPVRAILVFLLFPAQLEYCIEYMSDADLWALASTIYLLIVGNYRTSNRGGSSPVDAYCVALELDGSDGRIVGFGGSGFELANSVAVDVGGNIWLAGYTTSTDFPVVDATQASFGGGTQDGFVARVSPETFQVEFATYLGGAGNESVIDVKVNAAGDAIVFGSTSSADFPTTAGAMQPALSGGSDLFVTRYPTALEPDFSLSLAEPSITAPLKSKGQIVVDIGRTGGFDGEVTVTPSGASAIKVKLTPATAATTGGSVTFNYKVKKKATPGTYTITFTGRDREGRERSATLSMTITAT